MSRAWRTPVVYDRFVTTASMMSSLFTSRPQDVWSIGPTPIATTNSFLITTCIVFRWTSIATTNAFSSPSFHDVTNLAHRPYQCSLITKFVLCRGPHPSPEPMPPHRPHQCLLITKLAPRRDQPTSPPAPMPPHRQHQSCPTAWPSNIPRQHRLLSYGHNRSY